MHTPGHTPGSTSLFWERGRLLFSGDAVGGRGSRQNGFPLYYSATDYARSIKRLLDMPIATMAQAHRYRWSNPTSDAVRGGADVRKTLEESLAVWQAIDDAVRATLAADPDRGFCRSAPDSGPARRGGARQRSRVRGYSGRLGGDGGRALVRADAVSSAFLSFFQASDGKLSSL